MGRGLSNVVAISAILTIAVVVTVYKGLAHLPFSSAPRKETSTLMIKQNDLLLYRPGNYPGKLEDMVSIARDIVAREGVVMVVFVNDAYVPLAHSWLCNTLHMPHVHSRTLVVAADWDTGGQLAGQWRSIRVVVAQDPRLSGHQQYSRAGTIRIQRARTHVVQLLAEAKVRTMVFEVDCLWLRDPLPDMYHLRDQAKADIIATEVATTTGQIAIGFLLLEPSDRQAKIWKRVLEMMDALCKRVDAKQDNFAVPENENDQLYFTGLVGQKNSGLKLAFLPSKDYPDGKWYAKPSNKAALIAVDKPKRPVLINNNWIIGNTNKIERARKWGHWFWLDNKFGEGGEQFCNRTALHVLSLD